MPLNMSNHTQAKQSQAEIIASLPEHLRAFVATQNYADYTPRDQAVWRFLLHQLKDQLQHSAHPTYIDGLAKTGITLDAIPRIEDINAHLNRLGWRAVVVDGFLPPAIFMEFQAIKVLVIAVNIRSFEHMLYTPAPDIIHESAGHAPFLIDIDYAEFLQRFGELGMHAISNQHDMDVYEAVRQVSITKEKSDATQSEIESAVNTLETLQDQEVAPSEANLLARLHWWTVEYGLVGAVDDYTIYGAGLLSSLAEGQACLDDQQVTKYPLTINAIETRYDITQQQPQLFVTESCRHLSQVLEEYGRHMCCSRGGASALEEAKQAGSINTVKLSSGLQVGGRVSEVVCDAVGNAVYFRTEGPTQLAYENAELIGHGTSSHAAGFGSPIGKLRAIERCLSDYTVDELKRHQIAMGEVVTLNFLSGITVCGQLELIHRRDQKNILLSFSQCTVKDAKGHILFDPEWGDYDMAVGDSVVAVSGGSADQRTYPLYEAPSTQATVKQQYDASTNEQFELYRTLRTCREKGDTEKAKQLVNTICEHDQADWLLSLEAAELIGLLSLDKLLAPQKEKLLTQLDQHSGDAQTLIKQGMVRLGIS